MIRYLARFMAAMPRRLRGRRRLQGSLPFSRAWSCERMTSASPPLCARWCSVRHATTAC